MTNIYETKRFAEYWHNHTKKDVLKIDMMNKIMEEAIGDITDKIILEAGCGDGFFIKNLLKQNPEKIIGIDISEWLLEYAKQEVKSDKVEFFQMDLRKKLDFQNNIFDTVVSYNVLQEIEDIATPLREMTRVLKKGGKMIFSITHPLYHLFVIGKETKGKNPIENLRRYTKIEATHSLTIEGFDEFVVYRKPISLYVNEISKNGLKIIEMRDIIIEKKCGELNYKYKERTGLPVFLFLKLEKDRSY